MTTATAAADHVALNSAETLAAEEEKSKLRKHFGRFDMLFFLIFTLVGVDTLGAVASNGPEGFTWLIFLAIFCFVPYALLTAELGSAFTGEGGCYVWTRLAWGRFVASINTVLYWLSDPVWMGGLLCSVPILAILMVLPADQITGLGGFIDAMKSVFTVYGGEVTKDGATLTGAGKVLGDVMAAGFILVLLSSGTTWLMGSDRTQAVAGYDGAGPRTLGYFSARFGTPIVVNFLSGVMSTVVMFAAFGFSGGNNEKYFSAVLNCVLLFTTLSYIVIFPTLIKLRYSHPHVHRPYRVPFGMAGVWICGVLTTFWALLASVVGLFPGLGDGSLLNDSALPEGFSRGTFELVVFIPLAVTLAIGVLFYVLGRSTRAQIAPKPAEAPSSSEATGVAIA